jgi:hypothetical protein
VALSAWAAAWLPWLVGGAALSDATATAWAALAFAALTSDGALAAATAGAAAALMLGTRASYWPLAASFAVVAATRRRRRLVLASALWATVAWAVPFVTVVGEHALWTLGRAHLVGHFTDWGGSIATERHLGARLWAFVRGLVYDGLFANVWALAVAAPLVAWCAARSPRPSHLRSALVVAVPYALWVLLGQNVVAQPRHLLPLVALGCVALATVLARHRIAAAVVCLSALAASLPLVRARVRGEPAAAQAARFVAATWPEPNAVAVFGGRAVRFFDLLAPAIVRRPRTWLSEVDVELERLDVLPPTVLVTSEVEPDASRARRLVDVATFCRDPRLDRAQPCLTLRRYRLGR